MALTILLDSSPLGMVTKRRGIEEAEACLGWVADCRRAGHRIIAPAVARYEVARELERVGNVAGLQRLALFCAVPGCYLHLTDSAFQTAARLWAQARTAGLPTADPRELDCDVLLAAQALDLDLPSTNVVIATANVGHLAQFVAAEHWTQIAP